MRHSVCRWLRQSAIVVYVENFKSIAEYDCNTVKLLTKKGFLSIKGERLEILYYDEEEIAVRGRIISIEV